MDDNVADVEIRSTTHDFDVSLPVFARDVDQAQFVSVGVRTMREDLGRSHAADTVSRLGHLFDFEAMQTHHVNESVDVEFSLEMVSDPRQRQFHGQLRIGRRVKPTPASLRSKVREKASVSVEELADVGHTVAQHGNALNPNTEREALIAILVDPAGFQHVGIHHAGT